MRSDTPKERLGKVIRIDEGQLKDQLGALVRESVEETLNGLLDAEADRLCQDKRYVRNATRASTRAGHYVGLVVQIVEGLQQLIAVQGLPPGAKLPSIRQFAHSHGISVFTVVEAYDRLVALGVLQSRPNAGFFVRQRAAAAAEPSADAVALQFDAKWYLRQIFESRTLEVKAGCGWLPQGWLFEAGVRKAFRQLASEGPELGGYGLPYGHLGLRELVAEMLVERQITATADSVLLTQGC